MDVAVVSFLNMLHRQHLWAYLYGFTALSLLNIIFLDYYYVNDQNDITNQSLVIWHENHHGKEAHYLHHKHKGKQRTTLKAGDIINGTSKDFTQKYSYNGSATNISISVSQQIISENEIHLSSKEKILSHYYLHIPKTGGYSAFAMLEIGLQDIVEGDSTTDDWKYRPCNVASLPLNLFYTSKYLEKFQGIPCNLWMTEDSFFSYNPDEITRKRIRKKDNSVILLPKYQHAYTIIRSPEEHVISQYFHCKEARSSVNEGYSDLMPSLDEWLDHHLNRLEEIKKSNKYYNDHDTILRKKQWLKLTQHYTESSIINENIYHCYDPINLQSRMIGFHEMMSESDLRNRFDIIGDMNQFGKSVCAIFIRYTGKVPSRCDCSNSNNSSSNNNFVGSAATASNADPVDASIQKDHGVIHHGSTFKFNLTKAQVNKINELTLMDNLMYDRVKVAFEKQVTDIERDFGVFLCSNPTWEAKGKKNKEKKNTNHTKKLVLIKTQVHKP